MKRLASWLLTWPLRFPTRRSNPLRLHDALRTRLLVNPLEARDVTGNVAGGVAVAVLGGHLTEPLDRMAAVVGDIALIGSNPFTQEAPTGGSSSEESDDAPLQVSALSVGTPSSERDDTSARRSQARTESVTTDDPAGDTPLPAFVALKAFWDQFPAPRQVDSSAPAVGDTVGAARGGGVGPAQGDGSIRSGGDRGHGQVDPVRFAPTETPPAMMSTLESEETVVTVSSVGEDDLWEGGASGSFTLARTGDTSSELFVVMTFGGTAADGSDYEVYANGQRESGGAYFNAGQSQVTVQVVPLDDTLPEWTETVTFQIDADTAYTVGSPSTAAFVIHDYDPATEDADKPTFAWSQTPPPSPVLEFDGGSGGSGGAPELAEGDSVNLQVTATDPNNQPVKFAAVNLPLGLAINETTGAITGTIDYRAAEFNDGDYTPTIIAVDAIAASASMTLEWHVENTNRLPTLDPVAAQSTREGGTPWLTLSGYDPDGELLSFGATGLPPGLSVDPENGWVLGTVEAAAMEDSPYTVTASVTDGIDTVTGTFQWAVTTAVPDADLVAPQRSAEGDTISLQIEASDPHEATLQFSATNLPPGLSINSASGLISGTISAGAAQTNPYETEVEIANGSESVVRVIPWTVRHVFVTDPGAQTTLGGASVSLQVQARDPQNDTLQYGATGLPSGLSINTTTGLISGTVSAGAVRGLPYEVTVTATDGTNSDARTFAWTVSHSANTAPSLTDPGDQISHVDEMVSLQLVASDTEQDLLTYTATGLPPGIGIDPETGTISGQLYDDEYGFEPYDVTVTVNDGHGGVTSQTFEWAFAMPDLSGTPKTIAAVQGAEFEDVVVAEFTDLQSGAPDDYWPYSATIDWGDGTTSDGFIDGEDNDFQVLGYHTYKQTGSFTVSVTVTQGPLDSVTIESTANVSNPALTAAALAPAFSVAEGWNAPVVTFDDPNPFGSPSTYSATVTWADSTTSAATVYGGGGKFVVYTGRGFTMPVGQSFTVSVTDNEGSTVNVTGSATVGMLAAGDEATLTVSPYGALRGHLPPSGYSATIDWGDGSSSQNVVFSDPSFTRVHRYVSPGMYTVTIEATSPAGSRTDTATVRVVGKPLQVYREVIETTAGEELTDTQVGVIVNPSNVSLGTPSIDWGNGTNSQGTLLGGVGLYRLLGSTTYEESGEYLVFAGGSGVWNGYWRGFIDGAVGQTGAPKGKAAADTDAVATLSGEKAVHEGTVRWSVAAPEPKGKAAALILSFIPSADNQAGTITFLQVIREDTLGNKPNYVGYGDTEEGKKDLEFQLKMQVDKTKFDRIDMKRGETDPYYNAKWDGTTWVPENKKWPLGDGPGKQTARMSDLPVEPSGRTKQGIAITSFETAVFSVDSQEVLGVFRWGYKIPDSVDGKVELTFATMNDVSLEASAEFKKIIEKANTVPELKHAQLDGSPKITKPNALKFGGTSALPN